MPEQLEIQAVEPVKPFPVANVKSTPPPADVAQQQDATPTDAKPAAPVEEKPKEEAKPAEDQEEKHGKRRYERRLDKAYRKAAEEKARADFLEKQLSEIRPQQQAQQDPGAPTLEQYGFDPEKYAEAKAKYEVERTTKESAAKQRIEQQKAYQDRLIASWEERVAKAEDKYPDWDEKVGDIKPNSAAMWAVFEAENGPDIAHYLGSNPKEAQRIMQLSPTAQIREIGRLEEKLASAPAKPKEVSKAPAPIVPLSGGKVADVGEIKDGMNYKEFVKIRNKQLGRR